MTSKDRYKYNLSGVCVDLCGFWDGSADLCLSKDQEQELYEWLLMRMETWTPPPAWKKSVDDAWLTLVVKTLEFVQARSNREVMPNRFMKPHDPNAGVAAHFGHVDQRSSVFRPGSRLLMSDVVMPGARKKLAKDLRKNIGEALHHLDALIEALEGGA